MDDADGSFLDFLFGGKDVEETNSDTGKNNHKFIIASIRNQVNFNKDLPIKSFSIHTGCLIV